ncbi:protease pro-enzyme activation domain-containing protein [Kutzneria buriramensis]|uniref:Kumamolisin n=1 Tax=Kutzneria buriramensis TaxID=1045776 RepID=A0A3E0IAZ7_9PSEU|nr:S53 family serine peptidase [Kutzneria buriramensis]REH55892.1 kumamolisin [Kutzneria buriramensis]
MSRRLRALALAAAPLPLIAAAALAGSAAAATQPLVSVPDNTSPALAHSQRDGALDANTKMSVSVALKLRNSSELDKFIADASNPHSPNHGKFLTTAQFNDRFAPTQSSVDSVSTYLRSQGLTVDKVSANRQVVTVDGTAAQLQTAFGTSMGRYTDTAQHRDFYANDSAPQLPANVAAVVQGVVGLDNHAVKHTNNTNKRKPNAPSGYNPTQLRGAYDTGSLGTGSGQSVALWEFDGYQASNISTYDKQFSLSSSAPKTVSVDNANYDSQPGQGQGEVELDIEIVQAMAPAASTYVYEAPNSDQGEIDMANQIASDNKVSVVSISWGSCEPDTTQSAITSTSNAIKQATAEGISFFSASGDDGSKDCTRSQTGSGVDAVDYPASDPNVTGVGGTHLTVSGNAYGSETAWSGSGGGTSTVFDTPSWQAGVGGKRTVPDVSADADPNSGYAIYSAGAWQVYGGTSCAAPMWAGLAALIGTKLGAANQALYGLKGTGFHDVTSGSNGTFKAGTGYDQVTGWGSYDGAKLAAALKG